MMKLMKKILAAVLIAGLLGSSCDMTVSAKESAVVQTAQEIQETEGMESGPSMETDGKETYDAGKKSALEESGTDVKSRTEEESGTDVKDEREEESATDVKDEREEESATDAKDEREEESATDVKNETEVESCTDVKNETEESETDTKEEQTEEMTGNESEPEKETDVQEKDTSETEPETETGTETGPELLTIGGGTLLSVAGDGVSRVEWLSELTALFEMSVEQDNYPDNYFSDIDSSSPYYYAVMLATEFGLVDVEAGDAFRPDDAVTREFAAHTMNFCLGFETEENAGYSFNEADSVTYAEDIQVAVNRGWFQLVSGSFLPDAAVTEAEKAAIFADAEGILAADQKDPAHVNTYTFADGVTELAQAEVSAEQTGENELTFYSGWEKLTAGNKYGMVLDGFPIVFKVTGLVPADAGAVVQFETVPMEEAFKDIDFQGNGEVDLASIQAYSDEVELHYIVGGSEEQKWEDGTKYDTLAEVGEQEISAVEVITDYPLDGVFKDINLGNGAKAKISCKVSNVKKDFGVSLTKGYAFVNVDAKVEFGCNVNIGMMESAGISPVLELVRIPVSGIGYFSVKLDANITGGVTVSLVENVSLGLRFDGDGFRMTKDFSKDSFTIQTRMEISAGVTATLALNNCGFMSGELYAKFGAKNVLDSIRYNDGSSPAMCANHNAWLYATAGGFARVDFGVYDKSWSKTYSIYNEKNSPVRISFHYEDGVAVSKCSRGTKWGPSGRRWGYYTAADSRYGYNGESGGIGAGGEPFTIFEYSLDEYDNATITSYRGNVSALSIPETLDGHTVVGIGSGVFQNNKLLRMVVMPDSVTEIGNYAFEDCSNLSSVTLSKGVTSIGYRAFCNCDSLTEIEIPKSLKSTNGDPFRDCDGLKEVTFEKGTTEVASNLFSYCPGIEEITIPDTVTVIEYGAFNNCKNLCKVDIPSSVTEIERDAFSKCVNLERILIPDSVTLIGDSAFCECVNLVEIVLPDSVKEIGNYAFEDCSNLSSVTLSKGVTSIGYRAFCNCDSLTEIEIPKSLKSTNGDPFRDCDGLKEVTFEKGTTEVASNLFSYCPGIEEITIPDTVTVIEYGAFNNCKNLCKVDIPSSVTEIERDAFSKCVNLERILIPDSVTLIGDSAFCECVNLVEIVLPDSVKEIGNYAFEDCSNLSSVTLSKGVTSIGYRAFCNCDSLTEIEIPKSLKSTNGDPFRDCDGLKEVTFEKGTTEVASNLFSYCPGIEEITIPDTVTVIEYGAFNNCKNLCKVDIPSSVTEIERDAFRECVNLKRILIPDSVTDMGTYIFAGCSSLTEAKLPSKRKNITEGTFKDCVSLEKVNFPKTLECIRPYAFYNTKLSEAVLPESLTKIESYAFYNCDNLTKVELKNNLTEIGNYAFYDCDALETIAIPDSVTTLGTYLFAESELLSDVTLGTGITTIPSYAFNLCPSLKKIILPYRVEKVNINAFTNCTALTEITIPRATAAIADSVFSYPSRLTIYGISGTYAQTYADQIGATFVNKETKATSVSFNKTEMKLIKGSKSKLVLRISPSDFTDQVSWKSTDTDVAAVDDAGTVTAKAVGSATVKVTVGDVSASCKITVTQPVTSISLSKTSLSLEAFDTETLTASVYPSNAENKEILWSTSDDKIASVDGNGTVMAKTKGNATITAAAFQEAAA